MGGPRDPQSAEALQVPLSYPGLDDQADIVLASGAAEARRPRKKQRAGAPRPSTSPVSPRPARTLTEEQKVTFDQLQAIVVQTPAGSRMPYGSAAAVTVSVERKDVSGNLVPWDPNKIHTRYGDPKRGGVNRDGPGVLAFQPTYTPQSIVVEVDLWSEKRGGWAPNRLYVQDVIAYCPIAMNDLGLGERHVVASLFSEGGSNAATFSRDELIRVMWCFEHRRALLAELDGTLKKDPKDNVALARKTFAVGRGWGRAGTFDAVLTRAQINGIGGKEYKKALDPASDTEGITNAVECGRLRMTIDVALGVIDGSIGDPDAGRGNPKAPGCFYYMTKDQWKKNTAQNLANPKGKQKFAPTWPTLPSKDSEVHYYWGIEAEDAFR